MGGIVPQRVGMMTMVAPAFAVMMTPSAFVCAVVTVAMTGLSHIGRSLSAGGVGNLT